MTIMFLALRPFILLLRAPHAKPAPQTAAQPVASPESPPAFETEPQEELELVLD